MICIPRAKHKAKGHNQINNRTKAKIDWKTFRREDRRTCAASLLKYLPSPPKTNTPFLKSSGGRELNNAYTKVNQNKISSFPQLTTYIAIQEPRQYLDPIRKVILFLKNLNLESKPQSNPSAGTQNNQLRQRDKTLTTCLFP